MNSDYFNQESERLVYRALTRDDIPTWSRFFENNDRLHFFQIPQDCDPMEQSVIWMERQLDRYQENGLGMLGITTKNSPDLIGMVGLIRRTIENAEELEIGYSFLPESWGKGYATEAAIQMHQFARENNLAPRVISLIHHENTASMRVAEKNGMHLLFTTIFKDVEHAVYGTDDFPK